MTIRVRDKNRAALVKTIIAQNGGKIFTVIAKRKSPKLIGYNMIQGDTESFCSLEQLKEKFNKAELITVRGRFEPVYEEFMEMTCRTGVTKDLKGGKSTIAHVEDLISVHLTNGKGYRCFSAFNVLEIRASGTCIKFKESDVLSFNA